MFEAAEVESKVDKETYKEQVPDVRAELLEVQRKLATSNLSLVILIGGAEGAGKQEVVDLLLEWMDARGIETHAMWDTTDEEPGFWSRPTIRTGPGQSSQNRVQHTEKGPLRMSLPQLTWARFALRQVCVIATGEQ